MEFKGTKEKWLRDGNLVFAEDYFQSHIASTCAAYNTDIEEANAQLISKAPEMLEILKHLLSLKHAKDLDGKTPYYLDEMPKAWEKANQLIKEATTI